MDEPLVTEGYLAQFRRQCKGDQKVRHRQQQIALLLQPLLTRLVLSFGTMTILAGVIAILAMIAIFAGVGEEKLTIFL